MSTPVKHESAIAHRLAIVSEDVETHATKAAYLGFQGGPHPVFQCLAFHQGRKDLLIWMLSATADEIETRRAGVEASLGEAAVFKYRSMVDLPQHVVENIAHIELLEYGLGLHPLQQGAA